jgi:uncharacterized protein (DUF58 family)
VFGRQFIGVLGALLMAGLLARQPVLTTVCALALLPLGMAHLWRRWALRAVSYERSLSDSRVFPDSVVTMSTRVVNRKLLPLSRLDISDSIPDGIEVVGSRLLPTGKPGRKALARAFSLGWYEALDRRYELRCPGRGLYRFGPVRLGAGDPFGFWHDEAEQAVESRLLVYPRLLPAAELGFEMRQLLGFIQARQRLVVDPARTVGARDYHRDDPLKSIHWNATARRGALQTRVYEPVTALQVWCLLDISTFEQTYMGVDRAQAERLISLAATLCQALIAQNHSVGLATNAAAAEGGAPVHLPPSRSPQQGSRILGALAQLTPYAGPPISRTITLLQSALPLGTTVVLISAIDTEPTRAALLRIRRAGYPVVWLAQTRERPRLAGVTVLHSPAPVGADA